MLNVDLVGGCASFRQALGRDASPVRRVLRGLAPARALFKPVAAFLRAAWLCTAAGSSGAALAGVAALFCTA